MEGLVKIRLTHFYVPVYDPIEQEDRVVERLVYHGQRVTTDAAPDGEAPDPNTVYSVNEKEFRLRESQGVFFSDLEMQMMADGVTDDVLPQEGTFAHQGDTRSTVVGDPDVSGVSTFGGGEVGHPLSLHEMAPWQVEEYLRRDDVTAKDLIDAVQQDPTIAHKILNAENVVSHGEPRPEVIQGIAGVLGIGTAPGPDEQGVEGTAPESDADTQDTGTASEEGGQQQQVNPGSMSRDELVEYYNANKAEGEPELHRSSSKDTARDKVIDLIRSRQD